MHKILGAELIAFVAALVFAAVRSPEDTRVWVAVAATTFVLASIVIAGIALLVS